MGKSALGSGTERTQNCYLLHLISRKKRLGFFFPTQRTSNCIIIFAPAPIVFSFGERHACNQDAYSLKLCQTFLLLQKFTYQYAFHRPGTLFIAIQPVTFSISVPFFVYLIPLLFVSKQVIFCMLCQLLSQEVLHNVVIVSLCVVQAVILDSVCAPKINSVPFRNHHHKHSFFLVWTNSTEHFVSPFRRRH